MFRNVCNWIIKLHAKISFTKTKKKGCLNIFTARPNVTSLKGAKLLHLCVGKPKKHDWISICPVTSYISCCCSTRLGRPYKESICMQLEYLADMAIMKKLLPVFALVMFLSHLHVHAVSVSVRSSANVTTENKEQPPSRQVPHQWLPAWQIRSLQQGSRLGLL